MPNIPPWAVVAAPAASEYYNSAPRNPSTNALAALSLRADEATYARSLQNTTAGMARRMHFICDVIAQQTLHPQGSPPYNDSSLRYGQRDLVAFYGGGVGSVELLDAGKRVILRESCAVMAAYSPAQLAAARAQSDMAEHALSLMPAAAEGALAQAGISAPQKAYLWQYLLPLYAALASRGLSGLHQSVQMLTWLKQGTLPYSPFDAHGAKKHISQFVSPDFFDAMAATGPEPAQPHLNVVSGNGHGHDIDNCDTWAMADSALLSPRPNEKPINSRGASPRLPTTPSPAQSNSWDAPALPWETPQIEPDYFEFFGLPMQTPLPAQSDGSTAEATPSDVTPRTLSVSQWTRTHPSPNDAIIATPPPKNIFRREPYPATLSVALSTQATPGYELFRNAPEHSERAFAIINGMRVTCEEPIMRALLRLSALPMAQVPEGRVPVRINKYVMEDTIEGIYDWLRWVGANVDPKSIAMGNSI